MSLDTMVCERCGATGHADTFSPAGPDDELLCGGCVASDAVDEPGTDLYWSESGEVACLRHAPYVGSDTWVWGRWRLVDLDLVRSTMSDGQIPAWLACEGCGR